MAYETSSNTLIKYSEEGCPNCGKKEWKVFCFSLVPEQQDAFMRWPLVDDDWFDILVISEDFLSVDECTACGIVLSL